MKRHWLLILLVFSQFTNADTVELWSNNKKARAVCKNNIMNKCFIEVGQTQIDISKVEFSNLGKLGIRSKKDYEKVINYPSKWLKANKNEYIVNITTQAWFKGQRYTVTEPVYIKDGIYRVR